MTTDTNPVITLTEAMTLISLSIPIWGGRKKLRPEDLGLADADIPSEELVHWGSKRICNPEALRVFQTLKGQAERACLKVGTRFLGGFLVPNDQVPGLSAELERIKGAFEQEVQSFLGGYDHEIADWINRHPHWERQLREAVEPASRVATRFAFRYRPLVIRPADDHPGTLAEDAAELGGSIFHEIAQIARDLEKSLVGQTQMSQRALGTFRRVRDKLAVLSFVDPRIPPVLEPLEGFLRRVPRSGPITGALFREGFGLWLLLRDEDRLARHGAGILAGEAGDLPAEPADVEPVEQGSPAANVPEADEADLGVFDTEMSDPVIGSESPSLIAVPTPDARPLVTSRQSADANACATLPAEPTESSELFEEDCFF
ncbi:DUF3150 domain-containing protein [Thiorhodococcus mannitoliphagus]|uniref:DUF3150 domain-containing protein n=1 Tax=Thiorhodococcus mannitoliphagus TaxID=329406 RepID=A0A6P1DT41_9GAMM|nr:DUF3150 domain-containing protein [Thiorhodococcus mannitoliphagus]NEX19856.1 DUF3150 domain-containing protein [Thiorhodococcus mannitoliphagus]